MATSRICSIPDCGKPACNGRGWCSAHYYRWRTHGDASGGGTGWGEPERFYRDVIMAYEDDDCLIWPFGTKDSGRAVMRRNGRQEIVCRLICAEVRGNPPSPLHEAAHSCGRGDRGCVTKRHLHWKTHAENMADTPGHGTSNRGEKCRTAKLTADDVRKIRSASPSSLAGVLAAQYGVSPCTIRDAVQGKTWAWLE